MSLSTPAWRVVRTGGLLVPGFSKRFREDDHRGTTYLWGVPIGRFAMRGVSDGSTELVYDRWPVVDVVRGDPQVDARGSFDAAGYIRLPGGRRARFCRFRLERP